MRELQRSVARAIMTDRGYKKLNKKRRVEGEKGRTGKKSFFGLHWRKASSLKNLKPKRRKAS